ncbi:MAG: DUF554 domain-containing protein [Eggerthellales bacterium]|nr:DUF554 domain-containing protein [Eggerthellales bacterium]
MIGTIVNAGCILAGSLAGGCLKKVMSPRVSDALFCAMGMAATVLGINAVVQNMPNSHYPVLFIVSLAIGAAIGTALRISDRMDALTSGDATGSKNSDIETPSVEASCASEAAAPAAPATEAAAPAAAPTAPASANAAVPAPAPGAPSKSRLGEGLVTGCLLFCIGTLSILGPVQSALYADHTFLFTNAMLDLVTSAVLASTYGVGMCLAAGVLFAWQGSIYGLTLLLGDFISATMMTELSIVGGCLILMSGLSILQIKSFKTLDFLPALIVPVAWCLIAPLLGI